MNTTKNQGELEKGKQFFCINNIYTDDNFVITENTISCKMFRVRITTTLLILLYVNDSILISILTHHFTRFKLTTLVVICADCIGSYKSDYHAITATTGPHFTTG